MDVMTPPRGSFFPLGGARDLTPDLRTDGATTGYTNLDPAVAVLLNNNSNVSHQVIITPGSLHVIWKNCAKSDVPLSAFIKFMS